MNRKLYNELKAKVESLEKQINGGKGSGNFGHSGRPGEVGGSGDGKGVTVSKKDEAEVGSLLRKADSMQAQAKTEKPLKEYKLLDKIDRLLLNREFELEDEMKMSFKKEKFAKAIKAIEKKRGEIQDRCEELEKKPEVWQKLEEDYEKRKKRYGLKNRATFEELKSKVDSLEKIINGGKGSGNFGHSGRPGLVGGSGDGTGAYSKGEKVSFQTAYGEWVDAKVVRKLSDAEKKERAALANPDAGDYYEVQGPVGKHIVWEGKIKTGENESDIAKEYESRSEELGKLSDKIETALEEKLETTVSKKQAEDFITAVIGYNAKTLDKEEREELASDLMDDLKHVRNLKSKKVTIRLNPMSATNMTFEEA